jgi:hypothetical protein
MVLVPYPANWDSLTEYAKVMWVAEWIEPQVLGLESKTDGKKCGVKDAMVREKLHFCIYEEL